jgi:glucose/mannose-6-phosphate isomerase
MNEILDDLEGMKRIDQEGMGAILERLPEHCEDAIGAAGNLKIPGRVKITEQLSIRYKKPEKIVFAGMGGSAIGGDLLKGWLRRSLPVPIEVCREYSLPAYADEETLLFVTSYSGNTEEALSCLLEGVTRRCMIIAISSNGVLRELSEKMRIPLVTLPSGYPPRTALPYLFFPLVIVLEKLGVVSKMDGEINEALTVLKEVREDLRLETSAFENPAKKIATRLEGHIPLITGFGCYVSVALRMKTQFNENSKTLAKSEAFPELNHNEVVGWTGRRPLTQKYCVLLLRDPDEAPEIKTRIEVTKRLVFKDGAADVVEIWPRGQGMLARMLSTMYVGDFASFYLALLYGVNPTPVEIIDELKKQMRDQVDKVGELRRRFDGLLRA